jgi:hypothetical protein
MMNESTPLPDNSLTCFLNYNFERDAKKPQEILIIEDELKTILWNQQTIPRKFSLIINGSTDLRNIALFVEKNVKKWIFFLKCHSISILELEKQCGYLSAKLSKKGYRYQNPFEWKFIVIMVYPQEEKEKSHGQQTFKFTYHRWTTKQEILDHIKEACWTPIPYTTDIATNDRIPEMNVKFQHWHHIDKLVQNQKLKVEMAPIELFKEIYFDGDEVCQIQTQATHPYFLKDTDEGKDRLLRITFSQKDEKAIYRHLYQGQHLNFDFIFFQKFKKDFEEKEQVI